MIGTKGERSKAREERKPPRGRVLQFYIRWPGRRPEIRKFVLKLEG